ncbi:MAG: ATP-binding protein [Candidatus Onthomorpha sp.]
MRFADIAGQRRLINSLIDAVESHRVPHAQLFAGAEGYGAFALAWAYAQFVSCTDKQHYHTSSPDELKADSCGKCPSCVKYQKLAHPDLHLIFPTTTTKRIDKNNESSLFIDLFRDFVIENDGYIDIESWLDYIKSDNKQGEINVRDANSIVSSLTMTVYESPYKIMIIWCADRMRHDAAPKLLKILEEPYDGTLFLLVSANTEAILPTILSRVQLVKVLPMESSAIVDYLTNKGRLSQTEAQTIANSSSGNMLRALNYDNKEQKEIVGLFIEWTRAAFQYAQKASDILAISEKFAKLSREKQKIFLLTCSELMRECFMHKTQRQVCENLFPREDEKFLTNFSKYLNENNIRNIYNLMEQALNHVMRNANAKILFFDLTIQVGKHLKEGK